MSTTETHRITIVPSSPPSVPRVCLVPDRADRAVLDGGWWPRSTDPVAELPGLVLALDERYGTVRQLMLNSESWDSRPRRLAVGARVLRVGWFGSVDPALAIATTERGDQVDLLVVPFDTAEAVARAAMARAADPADTTRAPEIIASTVAATTAPARPPAAAPPPAAAAGLDDDPGSAWENEGGRRAEDRSPREAGRTPEAVTGPGVRS